jgi:uncharacterized protein (TIGR02231 family)
MHTLYIEERCSRRRWDLFRVFAWVLAVCVIASTAAAETIPSQIKEVTLFSNQALVKREAVTKVGKGLQEILLDVEAYRIDRDSVSAKVFGDGEIYSVQFRDMPLAESPQEKIKALEQKIRDLKKTVRGLTDEKEVLQKKEAFIRSVILFSEQQVPKEIKTSFPKIEDLEKTLRFINSNLQMINRQKQALDGKIEDTNRDIKVLEKELVALSRGAPAGKSVIEIVFNSRREQRLRVEADYLTYNASFRPLYKVTVPSMADAADLTMFGRVQQRTGEDWKRVSLTISNAVPLRGAVLPSLSSWIVDIERPRPRKSARKYEESFKAAAPMAAPAPAAEAVGRLADQAENREASYSTAEKTESALAFEYRLPQPLSIESRDKETVLPLYTKNLKGTFSYYAVPRSNPSTYLVMKAQADRELLPGPLNVYFAGRFVGKTTLGDQKAGEEMLLNLGADRNVKVQRLTVRDKIQETLFGTFERNTVVRDMAYRIVMENTKNRDIFIQVVDSVPVSRSDKVVVKDLKITPPPKDRNYLGREGVLLWEEMLKPGEKKEIMVEFLVAYPKDTPPIGL